MRIEHILRVTPRLNHEKWRFASFTIPNQQDASAAVDLLIRCHRKMRTSPEWRASVSAGIYVVEVKPGTAGWHVHLHTLMLGTYFPQHRLVHLWSRYSPGKIVDIRKVWSNTLSGYLTKYMTKQELSDEDRTSIAAALAGRRMFSAYAQAHTANATYVRPHFVCKECGCEDCHWEGSISYGYEVQSWNEPDGCPLPVQPPGRSAQTVIPV